MLSSEFITWKGSQFEFFGEVNCDALDEQSCHVSAHAVAFSQAEWHKLSRLRFLFSLLNLTESIKFKLHMVTVILLGLMEGVDRHVQIGAFCNFVFPKFKILDSNSCEK